jgi:hypothetical protein
VLWHLYNSDPLPLQADTVKGIDLRRLPVYLLFLQFHFSPSTKSFLQPLLCFLCSSSAFHIHNDLHLASCRLSLLNTFAICSFCSETQDFLLWQFSSNYYLYSLQRAFWLVSLTIHYYRLFSYYSRDWFFFFFAPSLELELRTYTFNHSTSPFLWWVFQDRA